MGVRERRDRDRSEMRSAMVTAVREIAASDGWSTVSIRKIAERTEYSPTLLYQYFESKNAVVHEIRRLGYEDLLERLQAAERKSGDARQKLRLLAKANVDLAFEQPEVFKAMLGMDGTPCDPPPDATAPAEIADLIRRTLQEAAGGNALLSAELDGCTEAFFAAVQGVVTTFLNELLPGGRKRAQKTVDRIVTGLVDGWFGAD
jgi:AcrR family transcriptional regulator